MKNVEELIESNQELKRFKLVVEVYDCMEKDRFKSFTQCKKYTFNERVNDNTVFITIYNDWTKYTSYTTRLYVNDFQEQAHSQRQLNDEQKIIQAIDHFQAYSKI